MLKGYLDFYNWLGDLRSQLGEEEGVETIEWIGLAAVVVALLGAVAAFVPTSGGETIGSAIINVISNWISQFGGG